MKHGYLSEYFEGVAAKRLSAVEADQTRSNQHEYQATKLAREFLGSHEKKIVIPARFIYFGSNESAPIVEDAFLTFYNCREGKPRSPEYRLYFPNTAVSAEACEGDLLVIAKKRDGDLLVVIAEGGSSIVQQIEWLFGLNTFDNSKFAVKSGLETEQDRIGFASRLILENIGIEVEASEERYLEDLLQRFPNGFPTTREFSAYARSTLEGLSVRDDEPDAVLMAWMEQEEILFRTLERYFITERLSQGFTSGESPSRADVDGFLSFSLSVQNRRKSRVGLALENHLELLFTAHGLRYARTAVTENKSKPDFLFPGVVEYHNDSFDPLKLTMLGVKSTCKDRWRQVLSEAARIEKKHLLTLEPGISTSQTDEMASKRLQLVLPRSMHKTYTQTQQAWLMDLAGFTELVRARQKG